MFHRPVVQIQSAEISAIHHHARALFLSLAVHRIVAQNAQYIQTAQVTEHVLVQSAKTPAQGHVVCQLYAAFSIIFQSVHVSKDMSEIHSPAVGRSLWKVIFFNTLRASSEKLSSTLCYILLYYCFS